MTSLEAHRIPVTAFYLEVRDWALKCLSMIRKYADTWKFGKFALGLGKHKPTEGAFRQPEDRMAEIYQSLRTLVNETIDGQCCMDIGIMAMEGLDWISSGIGFVGNTLQSIHENLQAMNASGALEKIDLPTFPMEKLEKLLLTVAPDGIKDVFDPMYNHQPKPLVKFQGKDVESNVKFDDLSHVYTKIQIDKNTPPMFVFNATFMDFLHNVNYTEYGHGQKKPYSTARTASIVLCTAKLFLAYADVQDHVDDRRRRVPYQESAHGIAKKARSFIQDN